jgi:SAM-dependent methyltransferase
MYDEGFYDTIRDGCQRSAAVVVPLLLRELAADGPVPRNIIDVGCGEGWWADAFAQAGCNVLGIDGAQPAGTPLADRFVVHDLTQPLQTLMVVGGDLVVCLEVAEHLPEWRAEGFIADLCRLAPLVLFSAAIPGQGGTGHVNEQWPAYWVELFAAQGYRASGALRFPIWTKAAVENWYRQNLLVFAAHPDRYPSLYDTPLAPPWPLVHPVLYDARRGATPDDRA